VGLCMALGGLALLVLFRNKRAAVNRLFGLAVLAILGWIVSISLGLETTSPGLASILGRLAFAFAAAMPFTLLWLFHAFPVREPVGSSRLVFAAGTACVLFMALSFSPWVLSGVERIGKRNDFIYGPLHPVYSAYAAACFGFALFVLGRKFYVASGIRRLQLGYFLLGVVLGGAGVVTTNLAIPLIWKTSRYSFLGPYFTLLMVSFSAHAIIRHRLMDIRLVIRRGFVYAIAAGIAGSVFVILIWMTDTVVGRPDEVPLVVQGAIALGIAVAFQPLKQRIQNSLDRYLYRESYDYRQIVREASRAMSALLDRRSLVRYLCETTRKTLRPDTVMVFTKDPRTQSLHLAGSINFFDNEGPKAQQDMDAASALPSAVQGTRRPFLHDELEHDAPDHLSRAALNQLQALGGDIAAPMLSEHRLIGLIILGPKLSGDPYFSEDIELLATLANQAAVAMRNAQLYEQVVLANDYIENILSTMDSAVVTVDSKGAIALLNATAQKLLDIERPGTKPQAVTELPLPLADQLRATLSDGNPRLQMEAALHTGSMGLTPIVCSTSALRDDATGAVLGALAVFSDLTKLKALEAEKRRAERLASFGALASGIAHEIKNPLVAIRTFAELLPDRFVDSDFREDFSKVVVGEIDRIDGLVSRLRGIASPSPAPVGPVDIREPLEDTLLLARARLEQTRTRVNRRFDASSFHVAIEVGQLKQLFLNLLLNALEAMRSDGELSICLSNKSDSAGDWIVAAISDNGPGIPEQARSHVFEPFFTTKEGGSGLGLAICRGIVDANRGSIRIESNQSAQGTTIVVELPAAHWQSFSGPGAGATLSDHAFPSQTHYTTHDGIEM
jgi:signal transduction histidine kinase